MTYAVVFTAQAEDHLTELEQYIASAATPDIAANYIDAIVEHCEGLAEFPNRGRARGDIRPGLRTTTYRGRTVIAYALREETIAIMGIFHGGRDYATILGGDP